tara:strand:+ start:166 stop:891 length:726 start_codon:yes stop_codon:yes gene_type:complete
MNAQYIELAKMIDHALLAPHLSATEVDAGIELARAYDVASVCIMPCYVTRCAELLRGSTVKTSTVIGFPLGVNTTAIKRAEATRALADGCQELDMVVNISSVISGRWGEVTDDIAAVIDVAHQIDRKIKVIFENCYLRDEQKVRLCQICSELNADWIKTSTGFGSGGATHEDLRLMRRWAAPHVQIKAAGGVRDLAGLQAVRELGVTRCGASRTQEILDPLRNQLGLPPIKIAAQSTPADY